MATPPDAEEAVAGEEVLRIALDVAERSLDIDLRSIDHHHNEIDRMLRLDVASMAALLVVAGVFATLRYTPTTLSVFLLAAGVLLNLASMLKLVFVKTGFRSPKEAAVGPDLDGLLEACRDPGWTPPGILFSLLSESAANGRSNQASVASLARGRKWGVVLWTGAVFLYVGGFVWLTRSEILG